MGLGEGDYSSSAGQKHVNDINQGDEQTCICAVPHLMKFLKDAYDEGNQDKLDEIGQRLQVCCNTDMWDDIVHRYGPFTF